MGLLISNIPLEQLPDFEQVKDLLRIWLYVFAFIVLGYYAYQQSVNRRAFYSLQEILSQVVNLYFCGTMSVFGNVH